MQSICFIEVRNISCLQKLSHESILESFTDKIKMYVLTFLMWISYWFKALYVVIHVLTHSSEFLICCRAFAISAAMDPGEPEDMLLSFWWYFNLGHPRFFQENVRFKKSFGSTQHVIKKTIERLAKKKSNIRVNRNSNVLIISL